LAGLCKLGLKALIGVTAAVFVAPIDNPVLTATRKTVLKTSVKFTNLSLSEVIFLFDER